MKSFRRRSKAKFAIVQEVIDKLTNEAKLSSGL